MTLRNQNVLANDKLKQRIDYFQLNFTSSLDKKEAMKERLHSHSNLSWSFVHDKNINQADAYLSLPA